MNDMEYKPNSHKYKTDQLEKGAPEKKKIEKVVTGSVKTKKKNEGSKVTKAIIAEDARSVGSYILMDVLIPAAKKTFADIVTNGINMFLYGESGRKNTTSGNSSYVSYRDYSKRHDDRPSESYRSRSAYDYYEITLETRAEANEVLERMDEIIEEYGMVSVGDLYDLVGVTSNSYTDHNYGWTDIRSAEPVMAPGGGWRLRLPKVGPLK